MVRILDANTRKVVLEFDEHGTNTNNSLVDIVSVAFSEDEKRLMTCGNDGIIIVRDIDLSGDEVVYM